MIKVGDRLPDASFKVMTEDGAKTLTTAAAEVEAVPQKDQGRGGVFGGYMAEGLVRVNHEGHL